MKLVKSLLLGSAAGLVAMSGAQAADLPVKAKAVEYVKVCSLYGAGFWYIPGTDTCVKLGGYLRVDVLGNAGNDAGPAVSTSSGQTGGAGNRLTNAYLWRSREDLNVDTRTATEYGVVRTYFDATFSWTTDNYNQNSNNLTGGGTVYAPLGGGAITGTGGINTGSLPNNGSAGTVANGTLGVYYAFIQFAGFTIGKAVSEFSAPWTGYPGNNFDALVGGGGTVTGVSQFTYTAQFGNGISAAISAQDQTQYFQAGVNNVTPLGGVVTAPATTIYTGLSNFAGAGSYGGTVAPDIVGSFTIDQAWGLFKASVAAHDNHAAYYGPTEAYGHPDDKWGFAGQLALSIKNIPTGPGDTINVQGVYTDGATRYNIQDLASGLGGITMFGGSSAAYQSVAFGFAPDSVYGTVGGVKTSQQLIQTWGGRGAFNHNWDPYWSTSLYGAFAAIRYNDTAKGLVCGAATTLLAGLTAAGCNPDYNVGQIGVITRWTPVKNLTFSADVLYTMIDQNMSGIVTTSSAGMAKPTATYELKDQSTVTLLLRAQRNW